MATTACIKRQNNKGIAATRNIAEVRSNPVIGVRLSEPIHLPGLVLVEEVRVDLSYSKML
jgi:hypothetical protein